MPGTPTSSITPSTAALLTIPPLMWAGNAVVGRLAAEWIPPVTFNLLRWLIAFAILIPLAGGILRPRSPMWSYWRRFTLLGLFAVAGYNMLQYLALHTSSPVNVTLVASSMPVWMIIVGRLFFGTPIKKRQLVGAALSLFGVLVVLSQGKWSHLMNLRFVPGDAWMLVAAFTWACYSWLLTRREEPDEIRNDWAAFLLAQIVFGLISASIMTGFEWILITVAAPIHIPNNIVWGWPLAAVLIFVAVGPSIIAYRCWGAGVQRTGPTLAAFFTNLTPLFAALMAMPLLGEMPQTYHAVAFVLIISGIAISSYRRERL